MPSPSDSLLHPGQTGSPTSLRDTGRRRSLPGPGGAIRWLVTFIRTPGRARELARYTAVSGASLGLDLAAFYVFLHVVLMPSALAGALSVMVGLVLHYALSVAFVFDAKSTGKSSRQLLSEYAITGGMGFVITAAVIFAAVDLAGLPPWFGKGMAVGIAFVSVYLVRAGLVFAPRRGPTRKV